MEQKAVFLDIDGTLTSPGSNEPPLSAQSAIHKAREMGHYIFLCSGRNYAMLSPLIQYGVDGIIASSGGYIECQGQVIYDCPMTEQQRQSVMEILKEHQVYRTVECMDAAYTDEGLKEYLRAHAAAGGNSELLRWREQIEASLHILPMQEYQGQPVYKVVVMSQSQEQLEESQRLLAPDFNICIQDVGEHGFVNGEVVNRQFDKGRAVERACRYLGIPLSHAVAIGDSMNDLEMLEAAGLGICMGNGSEQLKRVADDICPSVQEDGIYKAFEKYRLIA